MKSFEIYLTKNLHLYKCTYVRTYFTHYVCCFFFFFFWNFNYRTGTVINFLCAFVCTYVWYVCTSMFLLPKYRSRKKIEKRLNTKPTRLARNELVLYIKAIVSRVSVCLSVCLCVCMSRQMDTRNRSRYFQFRQAN